MNPVSWTLQYGSSNLPLLLWNIKNPRVSFRNQDNDEMTFQIEKDVSTAFTFAYGAQVTLWRNQSGQSVRWFQGVVSKREYYADKEKNEHRYTISGPWWLMSRTMALQNTPCYVSTGGGGCILTQVKTTKIVIFQNPATGVNWTVAQALQDQMNQAIVAGCGVGVGNLPTITPLITFEECRDLTIADAVRRIMQYAPHAVSWISYPNMTMNFQTPDELEPITLDASIANLIEKINLIPRNDLVPPGVQFNYVGLVNCKGQIPNGCVDPTTGNTNTTGSAITAANPANQMSIEQQTENNPFAPGGVIATFDLTQTAPTATEPVPEDFAGEYLTLLSTVMWDGTIELHEQDCSGMLRPGKVLNLSNGNPDWANMRAVVQEVTEELFTGKSVVTVGTPHHLSPQEFVSLIQMSRRRPLVPTGFAAVNTPGTCTQGTDPGTQKQLNTTSGSQSSSNTSTNGGPSNENWQDIQVCSGGTATTIKVLTNPN